MAGPQVEDSDADDNDINTIIQSRTQEAGTFVPPSRIRASHMRDLVNTYVHQLTIGCGRHASSTSSSLACQQIFCASSEWFAKWFRGKEIHSHAARQIAWQLAREYGASKTCARLDLDAKEQYADTAHEKHNCRKEGNDSNELGTANFHSRVFSESPADASDLSYSGRLLFELSTIEDLFTLRYSSRDPQNQTFVRASLIRIFSDAERLSGCIDAGAEMFRLVFGLLCDIMPDTDTIEFADIITALAMGIRSLLRKYDQKSITTAQSEVVSATTILLHSIALAVLLLRRYVVHIINESSRTTVEMSAGFAYTTLWSPANASFRVLFIEILKVLQSESMKRAIKSFSKPSENKNAIDELYAILVGGVVDGEEADECIYIVANWSRAYVDANWPRGPYSTAVRRQSLVAMALEVWTDTDPKFKLLDKTVLQFSLLADITPKTIFASYNSVDRKEYIHVLDRAYSLFPLDIRVEIMRHRALGCMVESYRHGVVKSTLISLITRYYPSSSAQHLRAPYQQRLEQQREVNEENMLGNVVFSTDSGTHTPTASGVSTNNASAGSGVILSSLGQRVSLQYAMADYVKLYFILDVSRDDVLSSVLSGLRAAMLSNTITKPLKVRFGAGEDGVDYGGVQAELFRSVGRQLCDPSYGMFDVDTESQRAWFSKGCIDSVERFEVAGALVALAVYNGCTISVAFPKMMYMMLLGQMPRSPRDIEDMYPVSLISYLFFSGCWILIRTLVDCEESI